MAIDTSIALGVRPPQFQTIDPMTVYSAMEGQRLNALRERALEQEMQRNALIMQNTMEDRRAAAAKAAQERAQAAELKRLFQSGYQPAKNPVMGPGTIQGATPAGFDYEGVKNKLIGAGNVGAFKTVSELQEQEAKRLQAQRAAENESATGAKTQAETKGLDLKNIDTRLATIKSLAPMVDTKEGAAAFSKLVTQIVPEFASIAGDPDEAAARNAEAFFKDPEAWRTQVSNLTAEQLVQAKERAKEASQPKPATLPPGAMSVDMNPQSPTYGKVVAKGGQTEQERKADVQTKQLKGSLNAAITSLEEMSKDGGLLDKATASGISALGDVAANFIGYPTEGAIATGELQVLQDPILKMIPRFEGPQSDKDTLTYQQAAGQLANPTVPAAIRKAAAKTLIKLFKERQGQFAMPDLPEANTGASNEFEGFVIKEK